MAYNNAFKVNNVVSSPAPGAQPQVKEEWAPGAEAPITEASFVWGEDPTNCSRFIIVETTISGTSYAPPQPGQKVASKKLCNIWPGQIYWTELKKNANAFRLFAKLNAMVLQRDANGVPILDEEGELSWGEGVSFTLCKQGLSKKAQADIAGLEDAKAKATDAKMIAVIDKMISELQASGGWLKQKLDSKSFVSSICGTGEALAPVSMYINFAFSTQECIAFNKAVAKLAQTGKPGLLRMYIPIDRLAMPKSKWEVVKAKVNNTAVDLIHPNSGKAITGPVFSWGNSDQPLAKVEIIPGKYLPSSQNMDRLLSVSETDKRVAQMERTWGGDEDQDFKLWAEALKGRFCSEGNQWAHKGGALPKRNAGTYATSCDMWNEAKESSAKLHKWGESLRSLVGVKPRLTEENQRGNDNKFFSAAACEAIIQAASVQSIQPWVDFVNSIGGGNTIAPTTAPTSVSPAVVEVVAAVVPSEPEVKAIEEPKASEAEAALSDEAYLAAIMAMREEQGLDELEEEEDLCADFFTGNIQE